jgi:hypothetical protein
VRVFVHEDDKLFGGGQTVQDLNAPAGGRAERAAEIIGAVDDDAAFSDEDPQRNRPVARIAGRLGDVGQPVALGLGDGLSRDSDHENWPAWR